MITTIRYVYLLIILLVSNTACGLSDKNVDTKDSPYIFQKLDLTQNTSDGYRSWDMNSPEARYEVIHGLIRAKEPTGTLYKDNKPMYSLQARHATIINDGEYIIMEGEVVLHQMPDMDYSIIGDFITWNTEKGIISSDFRLKVKTNSIRISID